VSPRASATANELARIALLASLPGQTLAKLASRMEREDVPAGGSIGADDRFYVVLSGMLSAQPARVIRPGEYFEGPARALAPATVVSCDRATFDELLRPLLER
jgi:hypothetical protein